MATSKKALVEAKEPSYVNIENTGKAYRDGWGWLIIPVLRFVGLVLIILLAVALREYYGIELAAISGAITGARQLAAKYLGDQKSSSSQ